MHHPTCFSSIEALMKKRHPSTWIGSSMFGILHHRHFDDHRPLSGLAELSGSLQHDCCDPMQLYSTLGTSVSTCPLLKAGSPRAVEHPFELHASDVVR